MKKETILQYQPYINKNKSIFKYPNKDNYLVFSAAFIIFFLIIRSIVESSFAVFGIDSLIFFSSYFYIEQCYKKNKIW